MFRRALSSVVIVRLRTLSSWLPSKTQRFCPAVCTRIMLWFSCDVRGHIVYTVSDLDNTLTEIQSYNYHNESKQTKRQDTCRRRASSLGIFQTYALNKPVNMWAQGKTTPLLHRIVCFSDDCERLHP